MVIECLLLFCPSSKVNTFFSFCQIQCIETHKLPIKKSLFKVGKVWHLQNSTHG